MKKQLIFILPLVALCSFAFSDAEEGLPEPEGSETRKRCLNDLFAMVCEICGTRTGDPNEDESKKYNLKYYLHCRIDQCVNVSKKISYEEGDLIKDMVYEDDDKDEYPDFGKTAIGSLFDFFSITKKSELNKESEEWVKFRKKQLEKIASGNCN